MGLFSDILLFRKSINTEDISVFLILFLNDYVDCLSSFFILSTFYFDFLINSPENCSWLIYFFIKISVEKLLFFTVNTFLKNSS